MKKIYFGLIIVCIATASCIKTNTTPTCPKGPESPLSGFLAKSTFLKNEPLRQQGIATDEIGFTFRPKVNGNITAFSIKVPNVAEDVPVTLWDGTSKAQIKTILISTTASDLLATKSITPIPVTAGKTYVISMNTNNSYDYQNADAGTAYPITVCNIDILNCCYNFGFGTSYPGGTYSNTKFRGHVDFTFEATE
jgi:hypothetical protein